MMTRVAFSLLPLLAVVSANGLDKQHEVLSELQAEQNGKLDEDDHGRELWWWVTSDSRLEGERCGTRNTCAEGLSCTQFGLENRCSARLGCLETALGEFEKEFDIEQYKRDIFIEAGVTQEQLIEAAAGSEGSDLLLRNQNVRSFISAMHRHAGQFDSVKDVVFRCSHGEDPEEPNNGQRDLQVISLTTAPSVSSQPSISSQPSPQPTVSAVPSANPSNAPSLSNVPSSMPSESSKPSLSAVPSTQPSESTSPSDSPSVSKSPSEVPSMQPSESKEPSVQPSVSKAPSLAPSDQPTLSLAPSEQPTESSSPSRFPSRTPTREPSSAPSMSPTLFPPRSTYTGFSIEGGALMEGSLTVFWENDSPLDFPPVYVKGCLGVGPVIGADLSMVVIVAETDEPQEIQCLSTMYDVDIAVGLGVGYGIGVCMLTDPTFVYQEFKFGTGLSFGASAFSVCDGAQIAQGYDDGKDSIEDHSDDSKSRDSN